LSFKAAALLSTFRLGSAARLGFWMALGGLVCPQLAATSVTPDFSARISTGMQPAIWRQQAWWSAFSNRNALRRTKSIGLLQGL
jgi:hypothetical protein